MTGSEEVEASEASERRASSSSDRSWGGRVGEGGEEEEE